MFYNENYKIWKKKNSGSGIGKINIVKMSVLAKTTHTFNVILIKITMEFFFYRFRRNSPHSHIGTRKGPEQPKQ